MWSTCTLDQCTHSIDGYGTLNTVVWVCLCAFMCLPYALCGRNVGLGELKVERHTEAEEGPWGERVREGGQVCRLTATVPLCPCCLCCRGESCIAIHLYLSLSLARSHPPSPPDSLSLPVFIPSTPLMLECPV